MVLLGGPATRQGGLFADAFLHVVCSLKRPNRLKEFRERSIVDTDFKTSDQRRRKVAVVPSREIFGLLSRKNSRVVAHPIQSLHTLNFS